MKFFQLLLRIFLLFVALPMPAFAWKVETCFGHPLWQRGGDVKMTINTISFSSGSAFNRRIRQLGEAWNRANSNLNITFDERYMTTSSTTNGINEIYYVELPGNVLGYTKLHYTPCSILDRNDDDYKIEEADVYLNGGIGSSLLDFSSRWVAWDNLNTNRAPAEEVLLHELGHVLGLDHDNRFTAIMTTNARIGPSGRSYRPRLSDIEGVERIYGQGATYHDYGAFAIEAFPVDSSSIEGSSDSAGLWVRDVAADGDNNYRPGDPISLTYGIENLGRYSSAVVVRWYLSTNDYISRSDYGFPLSHRWPIHYARRSSIATLNTTVPNVPSGRYYLGYTIETEGLTLPEYNGDNNSMAVRQINIINN